MDDHAPAGDGLLVVPRWTPALSVGHPLLDRHHILLLELARAVVHDRAILDDATLALAAADWLDLAARHCAAEENMLLLNGYEWLEQHRQEHRAGLDRLRRLAAPATLRTLWPGAVVRWLEQHLVDMDLPAREYLRPRRMPTDPLAGLDGVDELDAAEASDAR